MGGLLVLVFMAYSNDVHLKCDVLGFGFVFWVGTIWVSFSWGEIDYDTPFSFLIFIARRNGSSWQYYS